MFRINLRRAIKSRVEIALELLTSAAISLYGLAVGWVHYGLMGLISMVIVASVQAVGVVLVVAVVVTPGAVGVMLCRRLPWVLVVSGVAALIPQLTRLGRLHELKPRE